MARYVALLRGINVGGNKKLAMADLKRVLESEGFTQVRTVLNSGNVLFESEGADARKLGARIERALDQTLGLSIRVLVCESREIEALAAAEPFRGIPAGPDLQLYVTILPERPAKARRTPYSLQGEGFRVLEIEGRFVLSLLDRSKGGGPEFMTLLERDFGKEITTRNWNTVLRLLK